MSLWINGEWQSGRGPQRSKYNPVNRRCCGREMTPTPGRSRRRLAPRVRLSAWARLPFSARQDRREVCGAAGSEQKPADGDYCR